MAPMEGFSERRERLEEGPRVQAARALMTDIVQEQGFTDEAGDALAMLVVDASLDGDEMTLHTVSRRLQALYRQVRADEDSLRVETRGRALMLIDIVGWALERALAGNALAGLDEDSSAHAFLKAVQEESGLSNSRIAEIISVSDEEASRIGRRLADGGFATKRRLGRRNFWEITPKGLHTLELLENGGASRFLRPHLQLY
jgi:predicted transcriptional regulator